jgi:hypothetical protein
MLETNPLGHRVLYVLPDGSKRPGIVTSVASDSTSWRKVNLTVFLDIDDMVAGFTCTLGLPGDSDNTDIRAGANSYWLSGATLLVRGSEYDEYGLDTGCWQFAPLEY